jgi:exodeoxyribonuclease VII small subunit
MNDSVQRVPATYREAIAELDRILNELEGEAVQVDELALKVERAAWLITHCQTVLRGTHDQVKRTLEALELTRTASEPQPISTRAEGP